MHEVRNLKTPYEDTARCCIVAEENLEVHDQVETPVGGTTVLILDNILEAFDATYSGQSGKG